MKVGPPRHVNELADTLGKRLGRKEEVISQGEQPKQWDWQQKRGLRDTVSVLRVSN